MITANLSLSWCVVAAAGGDDEDATRRVSRRVAGNVAMYNEGSRGSRPVAPGQYLKRLDIRRVEVSRQLIFDSCKLILCVGVGSGDAARHAAWCATRCTGPIP